MYIDQVFILFALYATTLDLFEWKPTELKVQAFKFGERCRNYSMFYSPKHFRIHPAAFVSSHINKYKGTSSIGSHKRPRRNTTSTMIHRSGGKCWIMGSSFTSPYSSLPIIMVLVDLSHLSIGCCSRSEHFFPDVWQTNMGILVEAYQWFTSCGKPSIYSEVFS